MEYLENGDLKAYIQGGNGITPHLRLQWCKQASSALATLHKAGIFPRNFLLDAGLNVKIADFGGASLDGAEPSATPATRFRHPGYDWSVPPVVGDDIVSLGPLVYFIMTGSYPYGHVSSEGVDKLYEVSGFRMWMVLIGGTWL